MNKLITKIVGVALGLTMAAGAGVAIASNSREMFPVSANPTGAITSYSNITNGDYYIGATDGATDYYLKLAGTTSGVQAGTGDTKANATIFTVSRSNTTINLKVGNLYVATCSTNGSLKLQNGSYDWTASNDSSLIKLTASSETTKFIAYNTSNGKFGRYGGGNLTWFLPASGDPTITVNSSLNVYKDNHTTLSVGFANLTNNLTITQEPAESTSGAVTLCATENGTYTSSLTINKSDSSPKTIYVKGTALGKATLTFSSNGVETSPTCLVTISEEPGEIDIVLSSMEEGFTNAYGWYSWSAGTIAGQSYTYKNTTKIQFGKAVEGYKGIIYNSIAVPGNITGITITTEGTSTNTFNGYFSKTAAITSTPASGAVSTNDGSWTITDPDTNEYHYFYLERTGSSGACQATKIAISYNKVSLVDPTGIVLDDDTQITMDTYSYGRRTLSAEVQPFNNNDNTVIWGSSDESIVTVLDGVLTAKGTGTTTVFARTNNFVSDVATPNLKASVTVTVSQALYKKATFTPTSVSSATQGDDALEGGGIGLSTSGGEYTAASGIKLYAGNSATFTISGYAGMKITDIDLVMCSNTAAGSGSLTVTAGSTQVLNIADSDFSSSNWNGSYSAKLTDIHKVLSSSYVVKGSETIVFAFSCSVNSLCIKSIAIRYLDYSLEQWCENFLTQITCNESGSGSITSDTNWGTLGTAFGGLPKDLRDIAAQANADKTSESVIEQAMARYDLILRKYGIGTGAGQHTDFIGRFGVGTVNGPLGAMRFTAIVSDNNAISAIVIIISLAGATAVGGYFLLRKKKEER